LYGHKIILSARCKKFKEMFKNETSGTDFTVEIDMKEYVFLKLLEFWYTGKVTISGEFAKEILSIDKEYLSPELITICDTALIQIVGEDNVIDLLQLANEHPNMILKKVAIQFLLFRHRPIRTVPKFDTLSKDLLLDILDFA